ncbi:methyltransferase [Apiospora rasikravindrae]|uniref:Methyltransferase n=1 Tax=Apiospora rasikravindrae TaxID=990691 RepID=A0ABR1TZ36_9PEZI
MPAENTQPSQYDSIGAQYDAIKSLPIIKDVETANFPRSSLSGGAASVTGVDMSPAMIEVARAKAKQSGKDTDGRLKYQVGDVLNLGIVDDGGYDMVTGVWLLNYASSREELTQMYRGIRANLKPSGHFFGVCEEAQEDLDTFVRQRELFFQGNRRLFGLETEYTERLASGDGYVMETRAHVEPPFDMKTYHLRKSIIVEEARAAGLEGHCEMKKMGVPEEVYVKNKDYWALYPCFTPKFSTIFIAVEHTESSRSV